MQTSFSVTWKAEAEACRALGQAQERHCLVQLWFFTLTLTAQDETDDGIAEVLERVRFDRETNLC